MTSPIRPKGANSGLDLQGCRGLIFSDETRIRYCIYSRADLLTYFLGASGRRQREQGATNFGLDYWDVGAFLFCCAARSCGKVQNIPRTATAYPFCAFCL